MPGPLLLTDVPWLLYRSFFALPKSIADADGRPVNALLGTVNAVLTLIDGQPSPSRPRAVVSCLGAEQADYRVALYPPYHAHRDPMPPELAEQWAKAPALLDSLGWSTSTTAELEADDVMFSFARAEEQRGGRSLLMTGDRDLYGAVSEHTAVVELLKGGRHGILGLEEVRERYGVEPAQVPDLIALRGDPSDGLPGAPGVGAKTAAQLLHRHRSLEACIAAARAALADAMPDRACKEAGMRPRVAQALVENTELLGDFKHIATLQQIDVQPPLDRPTDFLAGSAQAAELGMRRLAKRLAGLATA
jgi:5'-3' exonuclease